MGWTVGKWSSVLRFYGTSWVPDKIGADTNPALSLRWTQIYSPVCLDK